MLVKIVAAVIEPPKEVELPAIVIVELVNLSFATDAATKLDPFNEPVQFVAFKLPVIVTGPDLIST